MTKTILVIDDEKELCEILKDELNAQGYKVEVALNGQEGLNKLQDVEPDLIICDRSMPEMTGYQLLERLRGAYPQYRKLPFIFLTALSDPRDKHGVEHLSPTAYLEKPINFDRLNETVKKALL
ncbi:MAG: response regulator [Micavibrio aeruginosavorus]|uniref:Response regulator n=1 Tax=Micavibrio aeruginosavorus TaxID=349221 RepID=A0A2W5FIF0_9BACT|nr:MAG: response regulator [Micavibrio aeruginosavorus]